MQLINFLKGLYILGKKRHQGGSGGRQPKRNVQIRSLVNSSSETASFVGMSSLSDIGLSLGDKRLVVFY